MVISLIQYTKGRCRGRNISVTWVTAEPEIISFRKQKTLDIKELSLG